MADPNYPPGSRAIKIPTSRMQNEDYLTPSRHRSKRDETVHRSRSNEGSGSDAGSSSTSSSRDRDNRLFSTAKTIVSPANLISNPPFSVLDHKTQSEIQRKDKQRATTDIPPPNSVPVKALQQSHVHSSPLSPSMLSSSSYKSINLNSHMSGDPDEPARLITYTKYSQGFTWNDELFLPSHLVGRRYRGSKGRRRWGGGYDDDEDMDDDNDIPFDEDTDRCPVTDVFVTDEEAAAMLP